MADARLTSPDEIHALLGAGTRYEGKLFFDGCVRIDGRFRGEIVSDGLLIVGEGAEIDGSIEIGTLIVRGGRITGDVRATTLVELHAPGRIDGDVQTPELFVAKGVVFTGRCTMGSEPAQVHTFEDEPSGTRPKVPASEEVTSAKG